MTESSQQGTWFSRLKQNFFDYIYGMAAHVSCAFNTTVYDPGST